MKKIFLHSRNDATMQKEPFWPYDAKVKLIYFIYSAIFWFLGLLVVTFSLFLIINLAKNGKWQITTKTNDLNFFFTPLCNLILVIGSWVLLLLAPHRAYKSPRHSSILFYCSFWFLVVSVILNGQMQLTYLAEYQKADFYHWVNVAFAKLIIILSIFALFVVQIFFWIMRRKFAFMPTDYEIYTELAVDHHVAKAKKMAIKVKKQNAKLANKKE